jgi:cobalt/nickel transport system permease protein
MTARFTPPPCPHSPLGRIDPRWRLAALALAVLVAALLRTVPAAAVAFAAALTLAGFARLPLRWYLERIAGVALFVLFFAAPLPFLLEPDQPAWHWLGMRVSSHGIAIALLLCLKAVTVVSLSLVLLIAGPLDATLKAAHSLRVPGVLIQLALLSYRYVFVLGDELRRLRVALRVRGFRNRATRHSYRTLGHVAGILLVRGHERAERVGQAMRCRGFDGRFRSLTAFQTRAVDVLFFAGAVAASAALWGWDWLSSGKG